MFSHNAYKLKTLSNIVKNYDLVKNNSESYESVNKSLKPRLNLVTAANPNKFIVG